MATQWAREASGWVRQAEARWRELGWRGEAAVARLLHPRGWENFADCGALFLDCAAEGEYFVRLALLLPGQRMPLHRHEERVEVFRVMHGRLGVVGALGQEAHELGVGDFMRAARGEKHGVVGGNGGGGALYMGECHLGHSRDVHWEPEEEAQFCAPEARITNIPLKTLPGERAMQFRDALWETRSLYAELNPQVYAEELAQSREALEGRVARYMRGELAVDVTTLARAAECNQLAFLQWCQAHGHEEEMRDPSVAGYARKGAATDVVAWLETLRQQ